MLSTLHSVVIEPRGIRRYHGNSKVKFDEPWPKDGVPLVICDTNLGEQNVVVRTKHRGAIARILRTRFAAADIPIS